MLNPDVSRVEKMIYELGEFGKTARGGVTRLTYTKEYKAASDYVKAYMESIGMSVEIDPMGSVIGTYAGKNPELPAILTGSHLDSVPEGGKIDGSLGIAASLECVHTWYDEGWQPNRDVKVIATIEEEGTLYGLGCFGARSLAGELVDKDPSDYKAADGLTLRDHLTNYGLDADTALQKAKLDPKKYLCYLEMHAEQGEELILLDVPCAIVTNIIGLDRYWVEVVGRANHAGTTRMTRRCDALVAASTLITYLNEKALASEGRYVATVGICDVPAAAMNIIPGKVNLGIESRFAEPEILDEYTTTLQNGFKLIEEKYGVKVNVTKHLYAPPVKFDKTLEKKLEAAATKAGVKHIEMPSWAGHDGKILSQIFPCGMIFAPSIGGISHAPDEATKWEDVAEALKAMNYALKELSE